MKARESEPLRSWYEVLDVPRTATAEDIKSAYDRAMSLVEGRSVGGYLMLDPLATESAKADIEAAYRVLGDEEKRMAFDRSLDGLSGSVSMSTAASQTGDLASDARVEVADAMDAVPSSASASTPPSAVFGSTPAAVQIAGVSSSASSDTSDKRASDPGSDAPKSASSPPKPASSSTGSSPPTPVVDDERESSSAMARAPALPSRDASRSSTSNPPAPSSRSEPPSASAAATLVPMSTASSSSLPAASSAAVTAIPGPAASSSSDVAEPLLPSEGTIDGAVIKRLRERLGISVDALAEATKIRKPYLLAIEAQDVENLPARVYLRGFLTAVARVLKVDRVRLAEGYLAFVETLGKK